LTTIQRIKQNTSTLLAIVLFFSIAGCRDFKDHRTPYKSFVQIVFKPINKDDKLTITTITNNITPERLVVNPPEEKIIYNIPLDPNTDFLQLDINTTSTSRTEILRIYYKREAVLISHQCGCAYKYIIKEIKYTPGIQLKIINKALSTFNDSHTDVQIYL
jgi:hypothetical protein